MYTMHEFRITQMQLQPNAMHQTLLESPKIEIKLDQLNVRQLFILPMASPSHYQQLHCNALLRTHFRIPTREQQCRKITIGYSKYVCSPNGLAESLEVRMIREINEIALQCSSDGYVRKEIAAFYCEANDFKNSNILFMFAFIFALSLRHGKKQQQLTSETISCVLHFLPIWNER